MRGRGQLDPGLEDIAFSASIGSVSAPVETDFGFHLVRVDSRSGDSVSIRHILIPVEVSDATEDSIFDLLADLEDRAVDDGLIAAAPEFGMTVSPNIVLTVGSDFVPGIGALGVAPEWAQDPQTQIGDVTVFESFAGQHVFELVSRGDAGFFSVEEVESDIRQRLAKERKRTLARDMVVQVADAIGAGSSLSDAAAEYGGRFFEAQTFRRLDFVPGLGQGSEAIGEAFGIGVGETSGVAEAGEFWAIVSVEDRTVATREEFEEQKELLRQQLTLQRRQAYMNRWLVALREKADVQDFRAQLAELAAAQQS